MSRTIGKLSNSGSSETNETQKQETWPLISSLSGKECEPVREKCSTRTSFFEKFVFFWFGLSSFITLMMILGTLAVFNTSIFPNRSYGVRSPYCGAAGHLLANITLLFFPHLDPPRTMLYSSTSFVGICLSFLIILFIGVNTTFGFYVCLALAFIQSWFLSAFLSTGFAFASVINPELPSTMALGIGVSGVVPVIIGPLLSAISPIVMCTVLYILAAGICTMNLYIIPRLLAIHKIAEIVADMRNSSEDQEVEIGKDAAKEKVSIGKIFPMVYPALVAAFLSTAVLFTLYPALCSFLRPEPHFGVTIVGTQSIGEVIGRSIVSIGFVLPTWLLVPVAIGRYVFVLAFRGIYDLPLSHILRSEFSCYTIQLLQGITFGYLTSSCFVRSPSLVEADNEKQLAGYFTTIFNNFGVPVGTATFKLLVLSGYIPDKLFSST